MFYSDNWLIDMFCSSFLFTCEYLRGNLSRPHNFLNFVQVYFDLQWAQKLLAPLTSNAQTIHKKMDNIIIVGTTGRRHVSTKYYISQDSTHSTQNVAAVTQYPQ